MRKLALASLLILFPGCESAKLKPWISYGEIGSSRLGINDLGNKFINVPGGDRWEVGVAFEFPLGPATKPDWPDLPPRYDIAKILMPPKVSLAGKDDTSVAPEKRVLDTIRELGAVDDGTLFKALFIATLLGFAGWWGIKAWKGGKNGKKKND